MMRLSLLASLAGGAVAVGDAPGHGVSKSTYATTDPVPGMKFLIKYLPVAESSDDCAGNVCTCAADEGDWTIQQGRVQLNLESGGRGFGMHMVNLTKRVTTGGPALETIEAAFATRLGDMTKFDAFMDHHVGLYTDDLAIYTSAFDADKVPYYLMHWTSGADTWYSASVHVPNTQLIVELLSKNYTQTGLRASAPAPSPRLHANRAAEIAEWGTDRAYVYAIRVSRAVANLTEVDAFYTGALGAATSSKSAQKACYKLATTSSFVDTTEVCFNEHADDKHDVLSVAGYVSGLFATHAALLTKPTCGMDKYLDNHLAVDPTDHSSTSFGDNIVKYIDANADAMYYCEYDQGHSASGYNLHYIIDPSGFGVQVDTKYTSPPKGCSSTDAFRRRLQGHENPACNLGTC